jgi:hypothetical protein
METQLKKKVKIMRLNLRFSHLNSTATPFEHFSRIVNKWSSIESKNIGMAVIK